MNRRQLLALSTNAVAVLSSGWISLGTAMAQPQATRLLVGATPGGGTDIVARAIALELGQRLDRPFIVENRPGAAGNIAALATTKAEPNGLTLLLSYTSHAINASLYDNLPFDPVKDFTPISQIASSPAMLVARPLFKANNVTELIALAKTQPGKLNVAMAGIGSANHLAGEMLKRDAGIDIVGVPYKGTGPAIQDVVAGQIDLVFAGVATVQSLIKGGRLKALAVTSPRRLPAYPDVPAISEVLPGYEYNSWYGLFGPAKMPKEMVDALAGAARAALTSPEMAKRLADEGLVPVGSTPAEFQKFIATEIVRWGKVVAATGAKPE
ncbi:tripartite tricarboxylate transporter substrate binding protein [Variovorax sp. RHLX14]|uniref:tripartite tricarboxylate transporter substrate binding protein n=1 Tax=Variovorax sp. RHLX14 TaxID=1259731 RepID=UPI003F453A1F